MLMCYDRRKATGRKMQKALLKAGVPFNKHAVTSSVSEWLVGDVVP